MGPGGRKYQHYAIMPMHLVCRAMRANGYGLRSALETCMGRLLLGGKDLRSPHTQSATMNAKIGKESLIWKRDLVSNGLR